ncbi:MAG: FliA/WhiG family RNA polymerase sigma factor [Planctomycetota bacterium]|nr:FliA/WhiG family RNA polymerase sigma factor [Planctomycetota bacterium]
MKRATEPSVEDLWSNYLKARKRIHKDRLVEHYTPLVKKVAKQLAMRLPPTVDEDDLMGAGTFGLFKTVENFDPERKVKFETYARLRVRGAMIDFLRQQDWIPREARNRGSKMSQEMESLESELGRAPTDLELARRVGMELGDLQKALYKTILARMVSLTGTEEDNNGNSEERQEGLVSDDPEPADILHRREMFETATNHLSDVERRLVQAYYFEGLTLKDIGEKEGISESRVCQIHGRMLDRLAERLEKEA